MREPTPARPCWKRRRWQLAAALWLCLPVLYVLGYAPARKLWWETEDGRLSRLISAIYWPLDMAAAYGPKPVGDFLAWYSGTRVVLLGDNPLSPGYLR